MLRRARLACKDSARRWTPAGVAAPAGVHRCVRVSSPDLRYGGGPAVGRL